MNTFRNDVVNRFAVIGNPIQQSLSPTIHTLFALQVHIKLDYQRLLVPLDGLALALDGFQKKGGCGVNITMPFKQEAVKLVDRLTDRASEAQAVNTITFGAEGGRIGDNTDGCGLVGDLTHHLRCDIKGKRILILGAGGAVQGILGPLLREQPDLVVVSNRNMSKAILLAEQFSKKGFIEASEWSALEKYSFDIIINGTSTGLTQENLNLPSIVLSSQTLCYDLAYGKGLTPFLQWASVQHAQCRDGLGMLIEQAAESFFIWHQIKPDTQPVLAKMSQALINMQAE